MNKIISAVIFGVLGVPVLSFGFIQLNLADTPTADTLLKGYYNCYFSAYEEGGIRVKVCLGLADWVTLGISEDIAGVIGDGKIKFALPPGVMAKFNLLQLERDNFGLALGYDFFTEGNYGKVVNVVRKPAQPPETNTYVTYGIYAVAALPVRLFNGRYLVDLGMRYPLIPQAYPLKNGKFGDLTLFAGLSLPFSKEFTLVAEIENFSFDVAGYDPNDPRHRRIEKTMINIGFKYIAGDVLNVSLDLRYRFTGNFSRIICIEYQNILF